MTTTDREGVSRPPAEAPYPSPAYAYYVLGVLTLIYIFSWIDRQIMSLLVGPIRRDLQISDTGMSLLTGFGFAVFFAFFGLPLARIADSGSRRGLIAAGVAMWSLFAAGCGLAKNFSQMLLMRMGLGVGEASLTPAAFSLITDYFRPNRRATAQGIFGTAIYLGSGVALILGGIVIGWADTRSDWILPLVGSIRSWQLVFFLVGLPGVFLALLMASVGEPVRRGAGQGPKIVPLREVLSFIAKNRATFVCHNFGFALLFFSAYGAAAWVPSFFIRHHHWSPAFTGQIYGSVAAISGAAGIACGGWVADRLAKHGYKDSCMRLALFASLLWIPTGTAYLLVPSPALAIALYAPTTFLGASYLGPAAAAMMEISPPRMRGQVGALYLFVATLIGLGIGPTAVALITDYVFNDDNKVGYSILIVTLVAHVFAVLMFWLGLKPFVRSKERAAQLAAEGAV